MNLHGLTPSNIPPLCPLRELTDVSKSIKSVDLSGSSCSRGKLRFVFNYAEHCQLFRFRFTVCWKCVSITVFVCQKDFLEKLKGFPGRIWKWNFYLKETRLFLCVIYLSCEVIIIFFSGKIFLKTVLPLITKSFSFFYRHDFTTLKAWYK